MCIMHKYKRKYTVPPMLRAYSIDTPVFNYAINNPCGRPHSIQTPSIPLTIISLTKFSFSIQIITLSKPNILDVRTHDTQTPKTHHNHRISFPTAPKASQPKRSIGNHHSHSHSFLPSLPKPQNSTPSTFERVGLPMRDLLIPIPDSGLLLKDWGLLTYLSSTLNIFFFKFLNIITGLFGMFMTSITSKQNQILELHIIFIENHQNFQKHIKPHRCCNN